MKNFIHVEGNTLPEAYHSAMLYMDEVGQTFPCPDYNSTMLEFPAMIHVKYPLLEPRISRMVICGPHDLQQYEMEVIEGILDKRIGHGWDYTYHGRFVEQIPELIKEFERNLYTRRAVLQVRDWKYDFFTTDPACLQLLNYDIRDNMLNCTAYMRSNDLYNATYMNMWGFIRLQEHIAGLLTKALGINITVGTYTHIVNSLHVYEKDIAKFKNNTVELFRRANVGEEITYSYTDDWKAQMKAEIPAIMDKVKTLTENL